MKSKSKTTQTYSHGWATPPQTDAQRRFDTFANEAFETSDPTIPFYFNNLRKQSQDRYSENEMFTSNYSPEVRDAARYNSTGNLDQAQGQALREDAFNRKGAKLNALAMSAQAGAPVFHQTGGTATTVSNPGLGGVLMGAMSAGASLGSAAIT